MKKKKSIKTILILIFVGVAVIGGATAGILYYRSVHSGTVEVVSVSSINAADWIGYDDEEGNSGTVVSDVSQTVRVPEDKVVENVYVEEGDKVKIGDKLLSYDKTLLELDQELQDLTVQELELEIKSAEADLEKLKNTTPSAYSSSDEEDYSDSTSSLLDSMDVDSDDSDDSLDEEARLMTNDRTLVASQEEGQQESAAEETTVQETESASSADTEQLVDESEETETQDGSSQNETEALIDNGTTEKLDGNDLNNLPNSAESEDENDTKTEDGTEKANINQSLQPFLTNLRIKAVEESGETLLADTVNGSDLQIEATGSLKLIPHFHETTEAHFEEDGTYTLLIQGITLKEDIEGKIYGIAAINGEDYPEIGAFILSQTTDKEQTAQLTIAFHDGLTEEHEKDAELEDLYLELPVTAEELTGEAVTLEVSDQEEENLSVKIQKPETEETETDETSETGETSETAEVSETGEETETEEPESEVSAGTEAEEEVIAESEQEALLDPVAESAGQESETESETETEEETEIAAAQSGTIHYIVKWNHGTNSEYNWPASLKVYFYKDAEDETPIWTEDLMQKSSASGSGSGSETGDDAVDEEATTEYDQESTTETGESDSTEDETESAAETEASTETEASEPAENITDKDSDASSPSNVTTWTTIDAEWTSDRELAYSDLFSQNESGDYNTYIWAYAENYTSSVERDPGSGTITITMTYQEPSESPLLKLNAIEELTYQHGVNTLDGTGLRAYKGSGTADDPYVFFVTDGVTIRNTFVNWVLGFNEDGTERISDGYYVRLEIRESDTITGAFIRSIDLDGTALTETGFGPGTYWIFNSETGITKYEEEVTEDPGTSGGGDAGWTGDNTGTYTAEELAEAISEKELEIKKLELDKREAELKLKQYNQELEDCTVVSAVDGYVQSLDAGSDDAYMVVASENGLYVKTTVSELSLDSVETGQEVSCTSWETALEFTATITEIEKFPDTSDSDYYYYSSGNVNSSNYPVLAVIDDETADVSEYESVSVKFGSSGDQSGSEIYLEKAYIRSENGQSYVYIADEDGKLKKQYIRTGGNSYGYIEIKQGLSDDDLIAFPYGKSVKEGAATVYSEEDEYEYY